MSKQIGIGLVGSGFMGKCHANAFNSVSSIFGLECQPNQVMLADANPQVASEAAARYGFAESTGDWRELVTHPDVEIVAITAPNVLHEPIALAAIEAGKAVYCEKPLSTTYESACRMRDAAEAKGVLTSVGFNFQRNPLIDLARQIIDSGEIGEVAGFKGCHAENYMASASVPHSFRTDVQGGGALADIGSHIIAMARKLLGPIQSTSAVSRTIHTHRPKSSNDSTLLPVDVDDMTHALVEFSSGVHGNIEANWAATGRTMDLSFTITGTQGAIVFTQARMNELELYLSNQSHQGFQRIETGPQHVPYGQFCPAAGHHLGFNDLKVIEVAELLEAYRTGGRCSPDFREAAEVQKTVEAMQRSAKSRQWELV